MVPPGSNILEIGCGHGDLLAHLKPALGVGIDFSANMIHSAKTCHPDLLFVQADAHHPCFNRSFDYIILSDLVNDVWDVQEIFENLHCLCHSGTRLILNSYNNLWRLPLAVARKLNLGADLLDQNWLSPEDLKNLLTLSGFETVNCSSRILLPLAIKGLSQFANRFLVNFVPFRWLALTNILTARPLMDSANRTTEGAPSVSVIVPARNEAGNILEIFHRIPAMGSKTEIIFVEGHSKDNTYDVIQQVIDQHPNSIKTPRLYRQPREGKGDAVRLGFEKACGDILMILDSDMTVPPEDLTRFYQALQSRKGDFINGVRLVYPLASQAMRFFNILGNKFFSLAFSWILGQPIKDTLCGTKVLWKKDYEVIKDNRHYFGEFDPFGDFDLLFGAAKLNLKSIDMPIRYQSRVYGETNIKRWRHGLLLLRMVLFAARRMKFI